MAVLFGLAAAWYALSISRKTFGVLSWVFPLPGTNAAVCSVGCPLEPESAQYILCDMYDSRRGRDGRVRMRCCTLRDA